MFMAYKWVDGLQGTNIPQCTSSVKVPPEKRPNRSVLQGLQKSEDSMSTRAGEIVRRYTRVCHIEGCGVLHSKAARRDMNLDPDGSWLIGDNGTDTKTTMGAGIRPIHVETGRAGRNATPHCAPEYRFPSRAEAINFLLGSDHSQ